VICVINSPQTSTFFYVLFALTNRLTIIVDGMIFYSNMTALRMFYVKSANDEEVFVCCCGNLYVYNCSGPGGQFKDTTFFRDSITANSPEKKYFSKQPVYKLRPAVDVPIFAIGAGWSGYAFTQIYSKDRSTEQQILSLDVNDINGFDRWGVRPHSETMSRNSNYIFIGAIPLPLLFLADKKTSKDFFKLTFLYLEAMSVTGFLYTGSVYLTNRYRPYAYSSETDMTWRTRGGAKNSFYAGHVALVATSTFFMAKVFSDYHPDLKTKWVLFSAAGLATGAMAYFRHKGGFHFPSDILLGITQGTLTGLLVPHFHKNPLFKNQHVNLLPYSNGRSHGLALIYKF
jgi:PAP2 superfamily